MFSPRALAALFFLAAIAVFLSIISSRYFVVPVQVVFAPPEIATSPQTVPETPEATSTTQISMPESTAQTAPAPKPVEPPAPEPPPPPKFQAMELNTMARAALVNILCATSAASKVEGTSGSGVFISERGVILTNAHIAEYFLLKDYPKPESIECTIRMGSPAAPAYHARLLYLPPPWVQKNSDALTKENPFGTGENDFAFLLVTDTTNPKASLPASFPALSLAEENADPVSGELVLAASYPAEFLDSISIARNLYAVTTITTIGKIYTFGTDTKDVFSIGGVILAEKGSSGGPIVNSDGAVAGILVTSTEGATTDVRDAFAITALHISRSFSADIGITLAEFLNSPDLNSTAESFDKNVAPSLTKLITNHFKKP